MPHPHTATLTARHETLESRIACERSRPRPDEVLIAQLKKQKLAVKEELHSAPNRRAGQLVGSAAADR